MRTTRTAFLLILSLSAFAGSLRSEESVCAVVDTQCWQRKFESVCRVEAATLESCSVWLELLERSPQPAHANVRLAQASANMALADLAREPSAREGYRSRARQIYRDVADDEPLNTRALLGLALFADEDERLKLFREAAASDPTNDAVLELLANELLRVDPLAGAEVMEQAYSVVQPGMRKWYFAGTATGLYEYAGATDRAAVLRSRVREDYELDRRLLEMTNSTAINVERTGAVLEEICSREMLLVFGAEICLESIQRMLDAADQQPSLSDGASRGIMIAAQSASRQRRS